LSQSDSLPPSAEKVMRALSLAAIDPGECSWQELLVAVRPMHPEAMESMVELLGERGYVTSDDWGVVATEKGRRHCIDSQYPTVVRT
jgi:hypothetical protein